MEQALSNAFYIDYKFTNARLKNTSYHFVKTVLTEMAHRRAQDEVFDRNIERWTKLSTFMDAFAKRALTSPRFVLPDAKFIRKSLRDQNDKRKKEPKPVNFFFPKH